MHQLLGKEAEDWATKCPPNIPPRFKLAHYEHVEQWIRYITHDLQYGDILNWPRILSDLSVGKSRAFSVFQPNGMIWMCAVFIYNEAAPVLNTPTTIGEIGTGRFDVVNFEPVPEVS